MGRKNRHNQPGERDRQFGGPPERPPPRREDRQGERSYDRQDERPFNRQGDRQHDRQGERQHDRQAERIQNRLGDHPPSRQVERPQARQPERDEERPHKRPALPPQSQQHKEALAEKKAERAPVSVPAPAPVQETERASEMPGLLKKGRLPPNVGPHPSYVQVAKPFVFEQELQLCMKSIGASETQEGSKRLQGIAWIDSVRRALQL